MKEKLENRVNLSSWITALSSTVKGFLIFANFSLRVKRWLLLFSTNIRMCLLIYFIYLFFVFNLCTDAPFSVCKVSLKFRLNETVDRLQGNTSSCCFLCAFFFFLYFCCFSIMHAFFDEVND